MPSPLPGEQFQTVGAPPPDVGAPARGGHSRPRVTTPTLICLMSDRAPRLRRLAERVESQAPGSSSPAKAMRLAREMRLRASELETGLVLSDEYETFRLLAELVDEA
jgi:hypothetical protein